MHCIDHRALCSWLIAPALLVLCGSALAAERLMIRADRLVDVERGQVETAQAILIEGERIVAVGPAATLDAGNAAVLDLGDVTLLPGLIDAHTHLVNGDPINFYEGLVRRSHIDQAVAAHLYARRTLEAGFTTVRVLGTREYVDVALREAIDSGLVTGPRLFVAGLAITATGGHGDLVGFSPYLEFDRFSNIADGPDEIRKLVRQNVKYGADLIKLLATAGVTSGEDSVSAPQFSQEEMNVAVAEAARWGRRVAAHAHGTEGIKMAVRAGVASIEHGSLLDDEAIRLMKARGTYLVADIYVTDYILAEFARLGYAPVVLEKERQVGREQRESFRKAVRAGVKIALGTDAGLFPHGDNAKQLAVMVEWGMTPMQAIQAATRAPADLLGLPDELGAIRPGAYADIIAVQGDPVADVRVLEDVAFVMKGGVVYKNRLPSRAD
jgi:imidazolonepropionase-like amidohydrolase